MRCENALSALAGICAAENGDPQKELTLVGLTGTNGKTSTSYILSHILNGVGIKTEVIGSVNFENTTPEPNILYSASSYERGQNKSCRMQKYHHRDLTNAG